jgi:hypothetical protein
MAQKRSKPAPLRTGAGLGFDHLGGAINFENIPSTPNFQALYVARHFRLPPLRATLIAEFAFQTGRLK